MNTKDKHMSVPLLDANPYRLISLHLDPVCLGIIWRKFKFCRFLFAVSLRQTTEFRTPGKKNPPGARQIQKSGKETFKKTITR